MREVILTVLWSVDPGPVRGKICLSVSKPNMFNKMVGGANWGRQA